MSEYIKALILGLVEGLTEFIPVSSTGHLILVGDLLKFTGEKEKAFEVFIQLGAILAVVFLYRQRFVDLVKSVFPLTKWIKAETYKGQGSHHLLLLIILASIVPSVVGLLFHDAIKALFNPTNVAYALIAGAVAFFLIEWKKPATKILSVETISLSTAFFIGCFQTLALWPGISRSGATIVGAILLGVERAVAADFSFLAAVPLITAAALLDFAKVYKILTAADLQIFLIGLIVSFIAGIASIKILISVLKRFSLKPFAIYRVILGALILIYLS
jgi:undecaprenyl-diphosphatase